MCPDWLASRDMPELFMRLDSRSNPHRHALAGGDDTSRAKPLAAVVVLNWNRKEHSLACLEAVTSLDYANCIVIFVDNASSDGSPTAVRARFPGVEIIQTGANLGYAGGNNAGIRRALELGADYVFLLNNDTVVDPDAVQMLVTVAEANPDSGALGPWIYYLHDRHRLWFATGRWNRDHLRFEWPGQGCIDTELDRRDVETDYVCGAALFLRAAVLRRIGLLDERFFLVFEESDWCFRAKKAGYTCRMVPEARVWHQVGASFGSESSPLRRYFSSRNELLWAEKNLPRRDCYRLLVRAMLRHLPPFSMSNDRTVPYPKRLMWAVRQYALQIRRMASDPRQRASRMGLRDYIFRRFGDCPVAVRHLNRAWANATPPTSVLEESRSD
jgi:hypothetical protein